MDEEIRLFTSEVPLLAARVLRDSLLSAGIDFQERTGLMFVTFTMPDTPLCRSLVEKAMDDFRSGDAW